MPDEIKVDIVRVKEEHKNIESTLLCLDVVVKFPSMHYITPMDVKAAVDKYCKQYVHQRMASEQRRIARKYKQVRKAPHA